MGLNSHTLCHSWNITYLLFPRCLIFIFTMFMYSWKSFRSAGGTQHFHYVCSSFALLTSFSKSSNMKSKPSLFPPGPKDATLSAFSSATFTAMVSSSSPKSAQSVFWISSLSSFSFISHSLVVFPISAFCCSFNQGTSSESVSCFASTRSGPLRHRWLPWPC